MDIVVASLFVAARAETGVTALRETVVVARLLLFTDASRAVCVVPGRDTALRAPWAVFVAALPRVEIDDCTDAARDVVLIVRGVNIDVRGASVFSVVAVR